MQNRKLPRISTDCQYSDCRDVLVVKPSVSDRLTLYQPPRIPLCHSLSTVEHVHVHTV